MKTQNWFLSARGLALLAPAAALFGLATFAGTSRGTVPPAKSATFADLTGHTYDGRSVASHRATAFVFLSTQCPVSKVYTPRLNALTREYAARGVLLVGVYANVQESRAEVSQFARDRHLAFPVVRDEGATLAARYGATMTPEAVVVDSHGTPVYKGRIDDSADTATVAHRDLRDALEAVLAGRPVARPHTVAFGCIIRRPAAQVASAQITYARDVAPILQQNCESCHRPGQIGPMPLDSYAQAAAWRGDIARVTQAHQMPPWKADPNCGDFQDARRLTTAQIATLSKWADAGAPEGDPKDTPPPPHFSDGWALGQPDAVIAPARPYHVAADGPDVYRCFVIPTHFTEGRWISAVDCEPGNRAVVHHMLAVVDATGATDGLDNKEKEPGYTTFGGFGFLPSDALSGWAPGITPHRLPAGVATYLPPGARVVIQVHYHKDGKPETDLSRIGLYFATGEVDKRVRYLPLFHGLQIPAGDSRYTVTSTVSCPVDAHLVAIAPHMHLLGRAMSVKATAPDGRKTPLVSVSDWDFNWQQIYYYRQPVALARGTKLTLTATYDNSAKNPRNPNRPPKRVTWGEQTTDEMCIAFLAYTLDNERLGQNIPPTAVKTAQR